MNRKIIMLTGVLMLFSSVFVNCKKEDCSPSSIVYVYSEPVIARVVDDSVFFRTQYGVIRANEIKGKVNDGDYLLTFFYVDVDILPYSAFKILRKTIGADTASIAQEIIPGDYAEPIKDVKLYLKDRSRTEFICVDSTFFMAADRVKPDKEVQYELIADKETITNGVITLYLRAKLTGNSLSHSDRFNPTTYALNLSSVLKEINRPDQSTITFNLKFLSGVDSQGNEVYKDYRNNPVTLTHTLSPPIMID